MSILVIAALLFVIGVVLVGIPGFPIGAGLAALWCGGVAWWWRRKK
jgi:hypothetical protein